MLTKAELAKLPGGATFNLTNESFCSLLLYIAKKEELENDKKQANVVKFLIDIRKYVKIKKDIESGKIKSEDVWEEFGNYIGINDCAIDLQEEMVVEESMEVVKESMEVVKESMEVVKETLNLSTDADHRTDNF